jgi:hypothetical protein
MKSLAIGTGDKKEVSSFSTSRTLKPFDSLQPNMVWMLEVAF